VEGKIPEKEIYDKISKKYTGLYTIFYIVRKQVEGINILRIFLKLFRKLTQEISFRLTREVC
jgi:hypothetical protein